MQWAATVNCVAFTVHTTEDPKILAPPADAWINRPATAEPVAA
jgi:hypothetical protein